MTTLDFIKKHLYTSDGKQRTCSSVFTDGNGRFYSYGYHYPLITRLKDKFYVNDEGYSVSTHKHINWARSAINYREYSYNNSYGDTIKEAAINELKEVKEKLNTLRKGAFRKKAQLEHRKIQLTRTVYSFADYNKKIQLAKAIYSFAETIPY